MKLLLTLIALGLAGCSSAPHYAKMPTLEERVADDEDIKPGMALTRHGAVIDIKVEEVQAQKARLEKENEELKDRLTKLQTELDQERLKVLTLRMATTPERTPAAE